MAAKKAHDDAGDQAQEVMDVETEQGFRGIEVDPTPNENYTVQGVTSGAPTPETDAGAAEDAHVAARNTARFAEGVSRNEANPKD